MELLMKDRYARAYVEVLEIIRLMGKEFEKKIPKKLLKVFEENKDPNYYWRFDTTKELKEQKLLEETLGILALIELKFWANPEEKAYLIKSLRENEEKYQKELREKYNPNDIFKKGKKQNT